MKKLIFLVLAICFSAGVVITTGELQSQDVQNEKEIKQTQIERTIVNVMPESSKMDTSSAIESQKIFRLKIQIKSEQEQEIIKRIGLPCEGKTECTCLATEGQVEELKKELIEFEVQYEGLRIRKIENGKGEVYNYNDTPYNIPDNDGWVASPIPISTAPSGAIVDSLHVRYDIIHPYVSDLIVDLTDQDLSHELRLWNRQGGSGHDIHGDTSVTFFNGELVNQTWYLWAMDCAPGDTGYIDCFDLTIWYHEMLPDLIVQSLTPTNYNPNVGDYIDVTMVIKNQGIVPASD